MLLVNSSRGASFTEDFATDPAARGWRAVGSSALFHWNPTNQNLEVTWDSRQPNSYYCRPLGTVLTRADDFSLSFDLRLSDLVLGSDPAKTNTFELAIGFVNLARATNVSFLRGTGMDSPNLVELDYFPDSGFGATISPTIIASNNIFASGFNEPFALTPNDLFQVVLTYRATNQTLVTTMTRNGQPFGPIQPVSMPTNFTDFRVDHVAIPSYSDAGQDPQYAGSILAHGVVDNLTIQVPDPPMSGFAGQPVIGGWRAQFTGVTNWSYALERSTNLVTWSQAATPVAGTGALQTILDATPATGRSFYRLRADRN